jgi:hypothetical protein
MTDNAASPQLLGFLADLVFVGCLFASALYGLWFLTKRPSLVGMARLSLVVSFGAVVTLFAYGQVNSHALSFPLFYLFILQALFLILEFLFQMSALGLLVSLVGLAIGAMHYFPTIALPAVHAPTPLVAYWWVLRDLAVTTGAAVLTLGLGTGGLLYIYGDRRPSPLVHPNDLRDVAAVLARGAVPCFFFGVATAAVALYRMPGFRFVDFWAVALLGVLFLAAVVWWGQAEMRQYKTGRGLGILILTLLLLLAYGARGYLGAG